jgi:hypothetical protein
MKYYGVRLISLINASFSSLKSSNWMLDFLADAGVLIWVWEGLSIGERGGPIA